MSSFSRPGSDRRRRRWRAAGALVAAVAAGALWSGGAGAAARLDVVAVVPVPAARYASVVTGISPAPRVALSSEAFEVTSAAGARLPATAMPVVSDELTTGLVLDTSADGGGALQAGLNGAASFLLQLPTGARTAVVTDGDPPAV